MLRANVAVMIRADVAMMLRANITVMLRADVAYRAVTCKLNSSSSVRSLMFPCAMETSKISYDVYFFICHVLCSGDGECFL